MSSCKDEVLLALIQYATKYDQDIFAKKGQVDKDKVEYKLIKAMFTLGLDTRKITNLYIDQKSLNLDGTGLKKHPPKLYKIKPDPSFDEIKKKHKYEYYYSIDNLKAFG